MRAKKHQLPRESVTEQLPQDGRQRRASYGPSRGRTRAAEAGEYRRDRPDTVAPSSIHTPGSRSQPDKSPDIAIDPQLLATCAGEIAVLPNRAAAERRTGVTGLTSVHHAVTASRALGAGEAANLARRTAVR